MNPEDKQELRERLEYSQEVQGKMDLTGRTRGHWAEVLEETDTEVYAYWAKLDDSKPSGYKLVDDINPDADELDLDLRDLTDGQ